MADTDSSPSNCSAPLEIKVRAERKCGEMLRDSAERGERATTGINQHTRSSNDTTTTLSDLGLTAHQSQRATLTVLDFTERDTIELLQMLLDKAKAGQIEGVVVAARMHRRHDEPYLFASSGRMACNQDEAIGAAALLQHKMLTEW